ncbi:MAG: hypothetical protein IJ608_08225 [Lachnospiraceae bacterium]|nr:hypothetical protein [Lachnospiraceae bacterium]
MLYTYSMLTFLTYAEKLYIGESIRDKDIERIKYNLRNNPALCGVYLLALSEAEGNLLEFYNARLLQLPIYKNYRKHIIGIAGSEEEAVQMVADIMEECFDNTGGYNVKEYLGKCS